MNYILIDMIGLLIATTILDTLTTIPIILWSATFFYGLFVASLYSCGISFCHEITNMSGKYIVIPGIGNTIGSMTMPLIGTHLVFGSNPKSFLDCQVGLAAINIGKIVWSFFLRYLFSSSWRTCVRKHRNENI